MAFWGAAPSSFAMVCGERACGRGCQLRAPLGSLQGEGPGRWPLWGWGLGGRAEDPLEDVGAEIQALPICPCRTFAPLWEVFRISSDKLALCHAELVKKLQDLIKEIGRYGEEQLRAHRKVTLPLPSCPGTMGGDTSLCEPPPAPPETGQGMGPWAL